jgi:hypothetical protein
MRILITTLIFLVAILNPAVAEDTWGKGDKVSVFYMCREEKDIMDIALADSKSVVKYITVLNTKQLDGACSQIVPPVLLNVGSVVSQYRDHKEKNTTILKLYDPATNLKAGYIIAEGVSRSDRKTSH